MMKDKMVNKIMSTMLRKMGLMTIMVMMMMRMRIMQESPPIDLLADDDEDEDHARNHGG
jgi:hypothetical protein